MSASIIQSGGIHSRALQPSTLVVDPSSVSWGEEVDVAAQARWYAVYTCANHERRVADQFASRNVEHFLPQYQSVRRWKDRKVRLQLPLFPGYLFVHMAAQERLRVLQVPGVVRLVGFNGLPVALPDSEIETLRSGLSERSRVEPHRFLAVGRRVRIIAGPFAGLEGVLSRKKNDLRIVVSLSLIERSIAVDVARADIASIE